VVSASSGAGSIFERSNVTKKRGGRKKNNKKEEEYD